MEEGGIGCRISIVVWDDGLEERMAAQSPYHKCFQLAPAHGCRPLLSLGSMIYHLYHLFPTIGYAPPFLVVIVGLMAAAVVVVTGDGPDRLGGLWQGSELSLEVLLEDDPGGLLICVFSAGEFALARREWHFGGTTFGIPEMSVDR